jgi:hypothetical protein
VTEADPTAEPSYATLQREVQRKLGLCLLRLQQYELLLKSLSQAGNLRDRKTRWKTGLSKGLRKPRQRRLGNSSAISQGTI